MPAVIPTITPAIAYRCYTLRAPDDPQWKAMITGVLQMLSFGYYWEKTGNWEDAKTEGRKLVQSWVEQNDCPTGDLCQTILDAYNQSETWAEMFTILAAAILASCGELLAQKFDSIASLFAIFDQLFGESADIAEVASVLTEWGVEFVYPQYRLDGCNFQVSYDGGETWVTQFEMSLAECPALQGPIGQTGSQGIQGPIGETGLDGQKGDKGDPGPTTGATVANVPKGIFANVCSGSNGIVTWASTLLESLMSGIDAAAAAMNIASDMMAETVIGDFVINDVMAQIAAIASLGTAGVRAAHNASAEQDAVCTFFCALRDVTDVVTAADIISAAGTLQGSTNLWEQKLGDLIATSDGGEFLAAYQSEATNEDNSCASECVDCPAEWCYLFTDATELQSGWTAAAGTYNTARWNHTDTVIGGGGRRLIQLSKDFTSTPITFIRLTYDLTKGDYQSATTAVALFSNGVRIANLAPAQAINGTGLTFTWTGNQSLDDLTIQVQSSADFSSPYAYSGLGHLTTIEMHGTGTNPFGSDNCEA